MKLLTLLVPCYNVAPYMDRCVRSLLVGGDEVDILLIDDGSTDETGAIADRYAHLYPDQVRVIHQPNGGHGEGINQGIRHAYGLYFKSIDADDWIDSDALRRLLDVLRAYSAPKSAFDLILSDFTFDRSDTDKSVRMSYRRSIPADRPLTWSDVRRLPMTMQFMIHSLTYRTSFLRDMRLQLPAHVSYEDALYIYRPLFYVKRFYYLDAPLYHYMLGREGQSISDAQTQRHLDQITQMAEQLTTSYSLHQLRTLPKTLYHYMMNHAAFTLTSATGMHAIAPLTQGQTLNRHMWDTLRRFDPSLAKKLRFSRLGWPCMLSEAGAVGRVLLRFGYRLVRKHLGHSN